MNTKSLTPQEQSLYTSIVNFTNRRGFLPKIEEITILKSKSLASSLFILKNLVKKGFLNFDAPNLCLTGLPLEKDIKIKSRAYNNVSNKTLSEKQKYVYDYIKSFIKISGHSPLIRDIMSYCGFTSSATVHKYLNTLEYKGYIVRGKRNSLVSSIVDFEETFQYTQEPVITSDLSLKQSKVYNIIVDFLKKNNRSPLIREIAYLNGTGICTVHKIMDILVAKKYVIRGGRNCLVGCLPKEQIGF